MLAVEFVNSALLRLNWPGVLCNEDIKKTLLFANLMFVCVCALRDILHSCLEAPVC